MKNKKAISQKAWCIKSGKILLPFTARRTRRESIAALEIEYESSWKKLKNAGLTIIKVEITEIINHKPLQVYKDPTQPFPQLKLFSDQ
ncbi:MAG: hypothetical protein ACRDE7_03135 [Sphingobacterium sp.]